MIRVFMVGYSEKKGGVETYIKNLTDNLDQNKYEIIFSMPEMFIDGKTWIRPKNRHNYISYYLFWKKFYNENHFDVLYYNTCDIVSIDSLKFAKAAGVPVRIIHAHSTGNQQEIGNKLSIFHQLTEKNCRKNLHKYATDMLACSYVAGRWMFEGREFQIIHNGIDVEKYGFNQNKRVKCRNTINASKEIVVGMIGRLAAVKNHVFALKVYKSLQNALPTAKFIIIGDGENRESINREVLNIDIKDGVILTGAVDNVDEWMSSLDCLIMPSLFEGLPFVLLEAQAAGLPCVVSSNVSEEANITGLIEYVDLKENTDVWVNKVLAACKKPRSNMQQMLADAGYSIKETTARVSEIIDKSLEAHSF